VTKRRNGRVQHIDAMTRTMCKSKIHRATVTGADLNYIGSITVDPVLMDAADLLPYEQVHVVNINNGARFETYVIPGTRDAGEICLNGAAARLVHPGDKVIIISYAQYGEAELADYRPQFIFVDEENRIARDHIRAQHG
jgi:aspartate 1-decarboxylase